MNTFRAVVALLATFIFTQSQLAAGADTPTTESELLKVFQSQAASDHDRAVACELLAIVGSSRSVPALKPLLSDEIFSHYARYALQNIPGDQAGEALRDALDELKGDQLIGVINSVAARLDRESAPQLEKLSNLSDKKVAVAAFAALVDIDPDRAQSVLTTANPKTRIELADVLLAWSYRLAKQGQGDDALELLEGLEGSDTPRQVRAAALLGRVRCSEPSQATSLADSLLASEKDWEFSVGLQAVVEGEVENGGKLLADAISQDRPARRIQILRALRGIGDRSTVEAARNAVASDIAAVRVEGIKSLGALGDASDAPLLVRLAQEDDQFGEIAREALADMDDEEVDDVIVAMLRESSGSSQAFAAQLIGKRRITEGADALITIAKSAKDRTTRHAALEAASRLAVGETLPPLVDLAIEAKSKKERQLAEQASLAAASRVFDKDAAAAAVAERINSTTGDQIGFLLDVLAVVGGSRSLEVVAAIAKKQDREAQDEATRVLGNWPTPDAALVLQSVASSDNPYAVRALRGYIRIARQFAVSESDRLAMCRSALKIAKRDEEKLLALQVLERIPSVEGLQLAAAELAEERLGAKASDSVVKIAEAIAPANPASAARASRQVIQTGGSREALAKAAKLSAK